MRRRARERKASRYATRHKQQVRLPAYAVPFRTDDEQTDATLAAMFFLPLDAAARRSLSDAPGPTRGLWRPVLADYQVAQLLFGTPSSRRNRVPAYEEQGFLEPAGWCDNVALYDRAEVLKLIDQRTQWDRERLDEEMRSDPPRRR